LREQIALPSTINADRLEEHHAVLDALGQIANEFVGIADIPSFQILSLNGRLLYPLQDRNYEL